MSSPDPRPEMVDRLQASVERLDANAIPQLKCVHCNSKLILQNCYYDSGHSNEVLFRYYHACLFSVTAKELATLQLPTIEGDQHETAATGT
jgi:hypothetical protein